MFRTADDWRSGETCVQWLARKKGEAADSLRVYSLLLEVAPLLGNLDEVGDYQDWLREMSVCTFQEATRILLERIKPWEGTREYDNIMNWYATWAAWSIK